MTAGAEADASATILVVDSEVLVRIEICAYLRDCGYRVIEASGAEEARQVLQQDGLAVGVVLCDLGLQGEVDGFALARWIREQRAGLDVILVATPARAAQAAASLCEKGPLLNKPYEPHLVLARIRRLLAARRSPGLPPRA